MFPTLRCLLKAAFGPQVITIFGPRLPAEGIYDQEVADHASDADRQDDGADGVVGVVRHVHGGKGLWSLG